tara:strand:+ start:277 stop:480 length:204 start_codon:yes stop_codon:yes gene_type:complete
MVTIQCTMAYKTEQLNLLLEIASSALGGKSKKGKRSRRGRSDKNKLASKEAQMIQGLAASGLPIGIE